MSRQIPPSMQSSFERTAHPFHMWEELQRTPETLASILVPQGQQVLTQAAMALKNVDHLHLIGCGTSYFAGIAGTYAFHQLTSILAVAHDAFEFTAYPLANLKRSALLAISHTGGTPVMLDAVATAAKQRIPTVGLTDVPESALASAADYVLLGGGGRELALPKTRSYVASLLKQYLLAVTMAEANGQNLVKHRAVLADAPAVAQTVLREAEAMAQQIAGTRLPGTRIFIFGAGPNVATANEGVLKLQEAVQTPAHAWELEEGMHGPWVSIEPGDLVIVLAFEGPSLTKARGLVSALQHIGAEIWTITDDPSGVPGSNYVTTTPVGIPECFTPLYAVLPLYLFAYHLALARGIRPDAMRLVDDRYLTARLALPR